MLLRGNTARFFPDKEGSNYFEAAPDKGDLDAVKSFQTSGRVASIGELLVGKEVRGARGGGVRGGINTIHSPIPIGVFVRST